jgi:hypothetical protein
MTSYFLSLLFFALKPIVKLLSIEMSVESLKYRSQGVSSNKLDKGLLRDYETAFRQSLNAGFHQEG